MERSGVVTVFSDNVTLSHAVTCKQTGKRIKAQRFLVVTAEALLPREPVCLCWLGDRQQLILILHR